ncbi:hypothetical protein PIPA1_16530 [Pelosinus sp. IPA-1]|nr:hypothetical protein PIPA1_16530 [Pelosinus sp. IPA-1]
MLEGTSETVSQNRKGFRAIIGIRNPFFYRSIKRKVRTDIAIAVVNIWMPGVIKTIKMLNEPVYIVRIIVTSLRAMVLVPCKSFVNG